MKASFSISIEPHNGLITITLAGFFDDATIARFAAERIQAIAALRRAPNQHITLCDVTDCKLQSQAVVAAFQGLIHEERFMSRRMAIVAGSPLARMQVRRLLTRDNARCFDDRAPAMAWLLDNEERIAVAG